MKKTLKRLPVLLAVAFTLFASSCSDIEITPQGGGDDDDGDPIIISPPPPTKATAAPMDTVSIG